MTPQRVILSVGLGVVLVLGGRASASAAPLRVGLGEVELEFPSGLDMWGYTPRPNEGVRDPLLARIFVLDSGDRRVALVTLDLGRTFATSRLDEVRERASAEAGIDEVIFVASHTHSGPYIRDAYDGGWPAWETQVLEDLGSGLRRASQELFESRIGLGRGSVEIGHNRRRIEADGSVTMLWANPERLPTAPVDAEVLVLRIDDSLGNVRAVLVGYACHPVVFGPDNLGYSADFPGIMSSTVRARLPGNPIVGFLQGAAGDINPFEDKRRLDDDAVGKVRWTGEALGLEVVRVAQAIVPESVPESTLKIVRESMSLALRSRPSESIVAQLTVLLVADRWAFIGLPGEPFVDFQLDFKSRELFEGNFLLGYTNGYIRYLPTVRATEEGGYGADEEVAVVEVGAGERLMQRAYEWLERWRDEASP